VIEGEIEIGGQEHFYLEGQAALALPQEGGDMVVHSSTQHPTEIQHKVAEALGLPMHACGRDPAHGRRLSAARKARATRSPSPARWWRAKTGPPCKMRYDRDDDMVITGKRHDFRIAYRAGHRRGRAALGSTSCITSAAAGRMDLTLPVADRAMLHADNAYFLPNMRIESTG
jgi:xanthine dehydrogenase large subunit